MPSDFCHHASLVAEADSKTLRNEVSGEKSIHYHN